MPELELPGTDLAKIAQSGQCFRLTATAPDVYRLVALGRGLEIRQTGPQRYAFACPAAEFDEVWRPYFDLDTDYAAIAAAVDPADAHLAAAIQAGQGIRILRQEPFEMLITFILSQRRSIPAIRTGVEALCKLCGQPIAQGTYAFPTAQALARCTEQQLADCRLGYRVPYVAAAARAVAGGALDLGALAALPDAELEAALLELRGVGVKVAACVMLFGFHRLGAFPRDVWVNRVLERHYAGQLPALPAAYAGVLQQYLFYYERLCAKDAGR